MQYFGSIPESCSCEKNSHRLITKYFTITFMITGGVFMIKKRKNLTDFTLGVNETIASVTTGEMHMFPTVSELLVSKRKTAFKLDQNDRLKCLVVQLP